MSASSQTPAPTEWVRFTPAARIKEGGFIRRENGSYQEIVSLVQVTGPAKFAMVTLADGLKVDIPHTREVAYRTAKQQAAAVQGNAPFPSRRPVDPDSKAACLAVLIAEKYPKDAVTELVDGETLTVYVIPAALGDWDWWLGRFHVQPGAVTHRGSYATAKGNHGSVQVLLTGTGVPALYAAERAAQTGGAL